MSTPPFSYGVLTDQFDQDLESALTIAKQEGISYVSLHRVWGKAITDLDVSEFDQVQRLIDRFQIPVNMICSLLFRPFPLDDIDLETMETHPRFLAHMSLLDRSLEIARALGAPFIRTFAFSRNMPVVNPSPRSLDGGGISGEQLAKIAKGLRIACERLEGTGVRLALENCRAFFANTGGNQHRILDTVNHPDLKIIWDPANAFVAGETPFPTGYDVIRDRIVDVHCKDSRLVDAESGLVESVLIGDGGAMWREQIPALINDGIRTLTLESRLPNLSRLRAIVRHAEGQQVASRDKV